MELLQKSNFINGNAAIKFLYQTINSIQENEMENCFFFNIRLYFQIVPNLLKSWEGKIARIVFQAWDECKTGGPNLRLNTTFQENDVFIYL